jgi:hypothetical protein
MLTQQESHGNKATALSVIPFEVNSEVHEQFAAYKEGSCNWIDLAVNNEVVELLSAKTVSATEELRPHVNPDIARYRVFGV